MDSSAAYPSVRRATAADAPGLKSFRCGLSPWYVRDAQQMVRRIPSYLDGDGGSRYGLVALLFECDAQLVAVSAFQRQARSRGELSVLAVETARQGSRLDDTGRTPLAVAVLHETLRAMREAGYREAIAWIAKENQRSRRLVLGSGFVLDETVDPTYDLAAARLG